MRRADECSVRHEPRMSFRPYSTSVSSPELKIMQSFSLSKTNFSCPDPDQGTSESLHLRHKSTQRGRLGCGSTSWVEQVGNGSQQEGRAAYGPAFMGHASAAAIPVQQGRGRRARVEVAHQERLMSRGHQETVLVHVDLLDLVPKVRLEHDAGAGRQPLDNHRRGRHVGELEPALVPDAPDAGVVHIHRAAERPDGQARAVALP
eukprot:scaffold14161_cov112-Isochrysis_galbana.AAC.2